MTNIFFLGDRKGLGLAGSGKDESLQEITVKQYNVLCSGGDTTVCV